VKRYRDFAEANGERGRTAVLGKGFVKKAKKENMRWDSASA